MLGIYNRQSLFVGKSDVNKSIGDFSHVRLQANFKRKTCMIGYILAYPSFGKPFQPSQAQRRKLFKTDYLTLSFHNYRKVRRRMRREREIHAYSKAGSVPNYFVNVEDVGHVVGG